MYSKLVNNLSEERFEELLLIGKIKSIAAHSCFINAGEIPNKIAFVKSGLFRYVYIDSKGDEFTKAIMPENNFISSYSAMVLNKPSYFSVEALESSQLIVINWSDFEQLKEKDVFWLRFLLNLVEKGYITKEKRERDLLLLDAETRYKNFLSEFPNMIQRVKQSIIASYLGIKPETLSRVRKKILS